MDPLTIGILLALGASGVGAAVGWRRRNREGAARRAQRATSSAMASVAGEGEWARVGDVLTYLGEEYWLAGELVLIREGVNALKLFSAPERGRERWVALPRDGRSLWVLYTDDALAALGWPGVEVPVGGSVLRRIESGNAAIVPTGEVNRTWEGMGRFATFRGVDTVAVVVESVAKERLALVGREIPRQLVQKMG